MGLGQWIQRTVGLAGGVTVGMEAPQVFTWPDGFIPVTITITGHKSEPRSITGLEFTLVENEKDSAQDSPGSNTPSFSYEWSHKVLLDVPAGETVSIPVNVALPTPIDKEDLGISEGTESTEGKGMVERMLELGVMAANTLPTHIHRYKLSVDARVDGNKMAVRDSKNIFHGGKTRTTFGIGGVKFS